MADSRRMSVTFPPALAGMVRQFAQEGGRSQSEAVVHLVEVGLAAERDGVFASALAGVLRDLMHAEMAAFARDVTDSFELLAETSADDAE